MTSRKITESMVDAALAVLTADADPPYMARSRDFTDAQVEAGELRHADEVAAAKNRDLVRRALEAALAVQP